MAGNVTEFSADVFKIASSMDYETEDAVLKANPYVVGIVSRNVPDDMVYDSVFYNEPATHDEENVFWGNGMIIECEEDTRRTSYYSSIILAPAALFLRTNDVPLSQIKVNVYLMDGKLCIGELFACDFHYNLAAIRIQTDSPLQTAKLRGLDDALSIDPYEQFQLFSKNSFQLRPHSNLFKVLPGTKIISPRRLFFHCLSRLQVSTAVFCVHRLLYTYDCKELYWIKGNGAQVDNGGPLVNDSGEVIGMALCSFAFLPSNIVSRWWSHYKSCRKFCRPEPGVAIANLHSARLDFLEEFMKKFPDIKAGVVVTEVEKDSPACRSEIQRKDVIIKCDGQLVHSKLEFFEKIWDKAGKTVELIVLRLSDGGQLNLSLTIGETTTENFYRWHFPCGFRRKRLKVRT